MMKKLSILLAVMVGTSQVVHYPHVVVAQEVSKTSPKGTMTLALNLDVLDPNILDKQMKLTLFEGDKEIGTIQLKQLVGMVGNYPYEIKTINPHLIELVLSELPRGEYFVQLEAEGYSTYKSEKITIDAYSKKLDLHTTQKGFTIGDITQDEVVDSTDFREVVNALGESDASKDLNKDGVVDIFELAVVNRTQEATGQPTLAQGDYVAGYEIGTVQVGEGTHIVEGSLEDMMDGKGPVKLEQENVSEANPLSVAITLKDETVVEAIELALPPTLALEGYAEVVYINEQGQEEVGQYPITKVATRNGSRSNQDRVVINLGKKVVMKKVTINVTKAVDAQGQTNYVTVLGVDFIQDIVPENPDIAQGVVKNVKAQGGDEQATLTWDRVTNISGYNVYVSDTASKDLKDYELAQKVVKEEAVITHYKNEPLENNKTYYFTVTSTQDNWESGLSEVVEATPQALKAPGKVDHVTLTPQDQSIKVSYQAAENATGYTIYYKEATEATYQKANETPITATSYELRGLKNDVAYDVYVTAQNSLGEGPASNVHQATPMKEEIKDPGVPTTNRLPREVIQDIRLLDMNNVEEAFYPEGFDIQNLVDDDFTTHWTAKAWHRNGSVETTFHTPHEMDYMVWVPRLDGNYSHSMGAHWQGNGHYQITIWEEGDDLDGPGTAVVPSALPIKRVSEQNKAFYILPFPKSTVKKIKVTNNIYAGAPTVTSVSELFFYEYDSLPEEIGNLFADATFTTLKSGVTQETINALRERLGDASSFYINHEVLSGEIELAQALLDGNLEARGVIHETLYSMPGLQPLGLSGKSGEEIVVYADIPEGETVRIRPTQYYGEVSAWKGADMTLQSGRNVITLPTIASTSHRGGPIYYTYSGENGAEVKLHAIHYSEHAELEQKAVQEIPVLDLYGWEAQTESQRKVIIEKYIHELTSYVTMLDEVKAAHRTSVLNTTELSLPHVLLSLPASEILLGINEETTTLEEKVQRVYDNTEAWMEQMHIMWTTYGVDEETFYDQRRENIRYMQMFSGAFMYAAGDHVGVEYGSTKPLVKGLPTTKGGSNTFGWGIAHEIGHNLDTIGEVEITNNIYSQFRMAWDDENQTQATRVPYEEVFKRVSGSNLVGSNNVFVELGMYWQLHLAYDGVYEQQEDNFYYNFNKRWRNGDHKNFAKADRVAVIASEVANKNLIPFFESWGKELSAEAKAIMSTYETETRDIQYLNDQSRAKRLEGWEDLTEVSLTTDLSFDEATQEVILNIAMDEATQAGLQGFKVSKNGKVIDFVLASESEYRDAVGAANNRNYQYTLTPVTVLGNTLEEIAVGDIKPEYDVVIDASQWTHEIVGDDIVITFDETVTASGVRLMNPEAHTADTIVIKKPTGEVTKTTPAGLMLGDSEEVTTRTTSAALVLEGGYSTIETLNFEANDTTAPNKFIAYFNKPQAPVEDKRIWNYDLNTVIISGVTDKEAFVQNLDFIEYPGDNVTFYDVAMGRLEADFVFDETAGADGMIAQDTVVILGTYRGDPVYNTLLINGEYAEVDHSNGTQEKVIRPINGYSLLLAEVPEDGAVSETSDGFFIFVPDIQAEEELGEHEHEEGEDHAHFDSIFPIRMQAELKRSDHPNQPSIDDRTTSTTSWMMTPSYEHLPLITFESLATLEGKNYE